MRERAPRASARGAWPWPCSWLLVAHPRKRFKHSRHERLVRRAVHRQGAGMTKRRTSWLATLAVLIGASLASAQGSQTGTLSGTVLSQDKRPLPGVTVTITSPALLGTRNTVTDTNGG